jgi:hypothetical protein
VHVPPSGISDFRYPFIFPSPPPESENTAINNQSIEFAGSLQEDKHYWYYYLTDIALRKIENSVMKEFYSDSSMWATAPVAKMIMILQEYDLQVQLMYV